MMNGVLNIDVSDESTTEPLTLSDVKIWMKREVSWTTEDSIFTDLIKTAREYAELYLNRSLIGRTVTATLANECGGQLIPMMGPGVDAITVKDAVGTDIIDPDIIQNGFFRYVEGPKSSLLVVSFTTTGYTSATLPGPIKTGMLQSVAFWYDHRGEEKEYNLPLMARATMATSRVKKAIW